VTTTPRRGCGQDYERKSILSERSAYGSDDSFRPLRSPATPTTGRPPVAFTDYDEGARTPTGPRSATATDRFRERDRGVLDVPNYFSSDGWATPVTSPRPAFVAGQQTAPMACPTVVQTSIGSPATPVNEYQAAPAGGPAQRHQSGAALNPAATNRGSDDTSREPPSAGQPPPGDNVTPTDVADSSTETTTTVDAHARRHIANVGVKLGTYDGSSCLETFLASLRNFTTYFKWNEEDELFHLRASLKGPAGQLLWDLGSDVTLAELIRLLRNRFGTSNQVERFRAELRTRKRRPGEQLQKLYNDICRLMSLVYPGPSSEIVNVVGREAFLEALGDPSLRIRILDKGPTNMEEALRIALNLKALDRSRDAEIAATSEKPGKRDRFVKAATQVEQQTARQSVSDDTIKQLQVSIQQCCLQIAQIQQDVTGLKQKPSPSAGPFAAPVQPATDVPPSNVGQTADTKAKEGDAPIPAGWAGSGPIRGGFSRRAAMRGRGPCHRCGQQGHFARSCSNNSPESASYGYAQQGSDKVQVVTDNSSKKDVYMPVKRKTVALLDTGCDTSIIGSRLLPEHVQLQASEAQLLAANGTQIPLLGELEVKLQVAGRKYSALVAVTADVDEFILGIDFLTAEACQWDFGGGRVLLGNSWVRLQKRDSRSQVRRIYVAEDCCVPPGMQTDVPVSVTWPQLQSGSDDWVAEPKGLADGVIVARTLFSGEALRSVM